MKRVAIVIVIVLAVASCSMWRSHNSKIENENNRRLSHLDDEWRRQPRQGLTLGVLSAYVGPGPADRPSIRDALLRSGKHPVMINLEGCAFPTLGRDLPKEAVILYAEDDERKPGRDTRRVQACLDHDAAAIEEATRVELAYVVDRIRTLPWVDQSRVMLIGNGEAGPVVASSRLPVRQRVVIGDPCFVPWGDVTRTSPLTFLFGSPATGLSFEGRKTMRIGDLGLGSDPPPPDGVPCPALRRFAHQAIENVIVAKGIIKGFDRPATIFEAQRSLYEKLAKGPNL